MSITKDQWRRQWLLVIYELTDYNYQKRTWLDKSNTNPHFSFTEFMCFYFDDILSDISYSQYVHDGWVTETELQLLQEWHTSLDKYQSLNNFDSDNQAVLDDPTWISLVSHGAIARSQLIETLSGEEKRILSGHLTGA